ncbi:peptidyl-prolyl cis-trans isomerase G-like [Cloeon dipterum]|uniref:peptidyl-prolyl cis-trans isomerase G-like n=1 Tax=Cloeon dipterum TaxID=197152 RepID=UPI0032203AF2
MSADGENVVSSTVGVRPRCFLDVSIAGLDSGRVVIELFSDKCPRTVENFRSLCTGEKGIGSLGKPLHYEGTIFHRVIKDFVVQGGDFTEGDGSGGESIYGGTFDDEDLTGKHDRKYLVSMANRGKNTNGSQFFILTGPAPHLDGIHTVFGHVVSGQDMIEKINILPVDNMFRPLQDVKVIRSGELVLRPKKKKEKKKKKVSSSSDSSDSEKETIKKKKKEKHRRSSRSDDETAEKEEEGVPHPLVTTFNISKDEIPEVPANFLSRNTGPDKDKEGQFERRGSRIRGRTKSGRTIKGRGTLRYRTPSRSRSRSVTPPHWRQEQKKKIPYKKFEEIEKVKKEREEEIKKREEERRKRHAEKEKRPPLQTQNKMPEQKIQEDEKEEGEVRDDEEKSDSRKRIRDSDRNSRSLRGSRDRRTGSPKRRHSSSQKKASPARRRKRSSSSSSSSNSDSTRDRKHKRK